MKKIYAIVMMAAALAACNQEELPQIVEEPEAPTYTMNIEATKGEDDNTKALSLSGKALNATWAEGEAVTVYNVTRSADLSGTLTAQSSGTSTVLKGTITGTIQNGDQLKLKFLSPSYTSQTGTLEYIAANCDYAEATTTVSAISDGRITASAASFTNQQAIVKFTLKNTSNATINATQLRISDGTNTFTVTPASATDVLYVALPGFNGKTVSLIVTAGGYDYDYQKSGVTFANGQYYEINVKIQQAATYTAPTLRTGLTFNGNQSNVSGSAQNLVNAGSVTHGTIYYSTNGGSSWSTSLPKGTNAGSYTVHYKVEPDAGYSGGVGSTSLGSTTIAKADGWCELDSYSSSGWYMYGSKTVTITVTHHGGELSYSTTGNMSRIIVGISGNTVIIRKTNYGSGSGTVTITSAATTNYNAASATYTCNQ